MFDFLFKNKAGEVASVLDIITANLNKLNLAALYDEKARGMIANAIAKSEILITRGEERRHDEVYFRLNVQPNDNQTGTDFWWTVVMKLLDEGRALIVRTLDGKYFLARSFSTSNMVTREKIYSNITLTDGLDDMQMSYAVSSGNVLDLRYGTQQKRHLLDSVMNTYNETIDAINTMVAVSAAPKFKYKYGAMTSFRSVDANGNELRLTIDDVVKRVADQITEAGISVIKESDGVSLEYMDIKSNYATTDLKNMQEQMASICAMAYDIPQGVFNGTITQQSDATNEFITYAVQPVAEVISDSLNAKLVGLSDYQMGERAVVWLNRFKHIDVLDAANSLDKLRGIGFTLDEIFEMVGYPALNTDFSTSRALTKNYSTEGLGEGLAADDPAEESFNPATRQPSKHKERRKARYERSQKVLSADAE